MVYLAAIPIWAFGIISAFICICTKCSCWVQLVSSRTNAFETSQCIDTSPRRWTSSSLLHTLVDICHNEVLLTNRPMRTPLLQLLMFVLHMYSTFIYFEFFQDQPQIYSFPVCPIFSSYQFWINPCYIFLNVSFFHPVQWMEVEELVNTFSRHNQENNNKSSKTWNKDKKFGLHNMSVIEKCGCDRVNKGTTILIPHWCIFSLSQFNITVYICWMLNSC